MPQSVTIDLPLVISGRGGLTMVRPIGFPDITLAAGSQAAALRAVRRRVIKRCSGYVGRQLVAGLIRGDATARTIRVTIAPERDASREAASVSWRDPIDVELDLFVWTQDTALVVAYVSALDLTVVATPQTDLEKLVQEQVRSAIRRRGLWSLAGLSSLDRADEISLLNEPITLQLPTPLEHSRQQQEKPKTKTPTLNAVATRLVRKSLSPAYFRDAEVEQLAGLLSASQSRSVLLVGSSGVGKTAVFHEWVRRRNQFGDPSMAGVTCWATDGSRLISGQTGFGMWQQQCLEMADEARRYSSVLHLGNLVELSESGRLRGSGGCGALLAPRLADQSLRAVIECTPEQLTRISRVEPRLVQALTVLRIEEPTPEQTRSILLEVASTWRPVNISKEIKKKRRKRKQKQQETVARADSQAALPIRVEPEALQVLDRLHRRFRTDAAAPGRPLAFFHAVMSELSGDQVLDERLVIEAFGRQTGLPSFLIDESVRPDLKSIDQQLKSQVIGQDNVIETLVDMIATLAADLSRGDRPLASMMLIGPTGVGKTETAKALARLIYSDVSRLVRIDMSELSSPTAVGRLIGDSMHPEGLLTSAVRAQPFSLVLLDEFEKAHPSVFDLLLQVLGEGRLTDGRGRLADFRNSIVMMTSNLGVESFKTVPLGLADTQETQRYQNHFQRQVRDFLRPELFNRIDRILTYDPLDQKMVEQIAKLRIDEVKRRDGWQSHGNQFDMDEAALQLLAKNGYEPQLGARPLTREVERSIVDPMSEMICLSGRSNKLDARVTTVSKDNKPEVVVELSAADVREKRSNENVLSKLEEVTLLRRRGQALQRCDALRRLRNQYSMVTRKIKTLLRSCKDEEQRDRIRHGPLGMDRMQTRERIIHVRQLCRDIDQAEAILLAMHYRGQAIDPKKVAEKIESIGERLWDTLCELQSGFAKENQRMSLVLSARDLSLGEVLIKAYRRMAKNRQWTLQAHALMLRNQESTNQKSIPSLSQERKIDCPGWSSEPAFRVSTERDEMAATLKDFFPDNEKPFPRLAAYRCTEFSALTSMPTGTLGLLLTFRGKNAGLMMGGEAGVHAFAQLATSKSSANSILVSTYQGMPIDYVAPEWLPRRDFQMTGHPRRWYDQSNRLVQDMTDDSPSPIKLDREGKWLESLIEKETERRVWAELEQEQESSSNTEEPDIETDEFIVTN